MGNCTVNLKYRNYWYNLLFISSVNHRLWMDNTSMKVAIVYYCLYHFTGFSKIIHVWIFIKMCLCFVYFFILSVNLKQIHLIDPLPSVFISLFIIFTFSSISKNDSFGITTISLSWSLSALATHSVSEPDTTGRLLLGTRPGWLRFDWTYFEQKSKY